MKNISLCLASQISGCIGACDNGDGTYRVDFAGSSRDAAANEILAASKASRVSAINQEATKRIVAAYPMEKQSSASLGIYPLTYRDTMIADIASVISASNTASDSVNAATTVAGVDAVVVNWPVIGA